MAQYLSALKHGRIAHYVQTRYQELNIANTESRSLWDSQLTYTALKSVTAPAVFGAMVSWGADGR